MGVTYKLKDEVVEFILLQKRDHPQISCRKLVEIVQNRFQVPVSKSSINSVLKSAHLSSPVGRRAVLAKKEKKFKIPSEKKLGSLSGSKIAGFIGEETRKPEERSLIAAPDKPEDLTEGMGNIFLKAAQWDLFGKSILGECFKGQFQSLKSLKADQAGDILLFCKAFGVNSAEQLRDYRGKGLWELNGLRERPSEYDLITMGIAANDFKKQDCKTLKEIPFLFTEVAYLRIILEDRSEIFIDGHFTSIWPKRPEMNLSWPIDKVVKFLSTYLIANREPFIPKNILVKDGFPKEMAGFLLAGENLDGKRMEKISLYNQNDEELAGFSSIPRKTRGIISAVYSDQIELNKVLKEKNSASPHSWKHPVSGEDFYWIEVNSSLFPEISNKVFSLNRCILISRNDPAEVPYLGLVTNLSKEDIPGAEIITRFYQRWGNVFEEATSCQEIFDVYQTKEAQSQCVLTSPGSLEGQQGFYAVTQEILKALGDYCITHYFIYGYNRENNYSFLEDLQRLKGKILYLNQSIQIKLEPSSCKTISSKEFKLARKVFNEEFVFNEDGKNVSLNYY